MRWKCALEMSILMCTLLVFACNWSIGWIDIADIRLDFDLTPVEYGPNPRGLPISFHRPVPSEAHLWLCNRVVLIDLRHAWIDFLVFLPVEKAVLRWVLLRHTMADPQNVLLWNWRENSPWKWNKTPLTLFYQTKSMKNKQKVIDYSIRFYL